MSRFTRTLYWAMLVAAIISSFRHDVHGTILFFLVAVLARVELLAVQLGESHAAPPDRQDHRRPG